MSTWVRLGGWVPRLKKIKNTFIFRTFIALTRVSMWIPEYRWTPSLVSWTEFNGYEIIQCQQTGWANWPCYLYSISGFLWDFSTSLESRLSQSTLLIWFGSLSLGRLRSKCAFVFLTVLIAWSTSISARLSEVLPACISASLKAASLLFPFLWLTLHLPCKSYKFCTLASKLHLYLNSVRNFHAWLNLFMFLLSDRMCRI